MSQRGRVIMAFLHQKDKHRREEIKFAGPSVSRIRAQGAVVSPEVGSPELLRQMALSGDSARPPWPAVFEQSLFSALDWGAMVRAGCCGLAE